MTSKQFSVLAILLMLSWGNLCWAQPDEDKESVSVTEEQSNEPVQSKIQGQLSEQELEDLLWMVEEERLAHDVYVKLGSKSNLRMYDNISRAEKVHIAALSSLLKNYGVDEHSLGKECGKFTHSEIQGLYNELVDRGEKSLEDAIVVGLLIEEMDIADLSKRIDRTEKKDVKQVYQFLQLGSRNHLRAFSRQASFRNVEYVPQHLSQNEFDDIVGGERERGRPGRGRRRF
ncbi:DUF2202 domain-containing protein [Bythopirellula polymerisocia]|uniref:DUF2202 domain-containing protein n=1 Tax=Bythopirellula polymerisocia TaxID=2528003 RepID=A0A5C6D2C0_9BACT|nr:DUF2202 domain-containing protein [Bythopirellula polymerisocia]TWU29807.1 hypothetical protein Pla144_05860 [Bythopirellula polymerisocia]